MAYSRKHVTLSSMSAEALVTEHHKRPTMDVQRLEEERAIAAAEKHLGETPRIVVCGKTGAGKSSLINVLLEREANLVGHSEPTTQDEQEEAKVCVSWTYRALERPTSIMNG